MRGPEGYRGSVWYGLDSTEERSSMLLDHRFTSSGPLRFEQLRQYPNDLA